MLSGREEKEEKEKKRRRERTKRIERGEQQEAGEVEKKDGDYEGKERKMGQERNSMRRIRKTRRDRDK